MSKSTLSEEYVSEDETFSWKVHQVPGKIRRTLNQIFPELKLLGQDTTIHAVVLVQHAQNSMEGYSETVEEERMTLTGKFLNWSRDIVDVLKKDYWCDVIDPSSGIPFYGKRGTTVFIETEDVMFDIGYEVLDFGCCKSLTHKRWGTYSFFGILFTTCPEEELTEILKNHSHNFE